MNGCKKHRKNNMLKNCCQVHSQRKREGNKTSIRKPGFWDNAESLKLPRLARETYLEFIGKKVASVVLKDKS